jgi:glutathione S-transferase
VNVHPRRRDEAAAFAAANPLQRVPTLVDGDEAVYETGAVLTYLGDRFAAAGLAPAVGAPGRGAYLRWMTWLSNTLHTIWYPAQYPGILADDPVAHEAIVAKGLGRIAAAGAYIEAELEGRDWCVGTSFTLVDIYLYMLTAWRSYNEEPVPFGGPNLEAHFERVGARPAIIRTRELDDLKPDFQRNHPELRAGVAV